MPINLDRLRRLLAFLLELLGPDHPAVVEMKAKVRHHLDACHADCIEAAIAGNLTSLVHLCHLRECCDVPGPDEKK